jgi:hypothetical protein
MMMKKYFLFLLIVLSTVMATQVYAETLASSGFIPGQIWYSKAELVEGDTVNIHTAIWNAEKNTLAAKVEFYDKNVILGSRDVILAPSELKDVSVSWKITAGDHVISAKIISSLATVSGVKEKVVLERIVTSNDRQFVSVQVKDNSLEKTADDKKLQTQIDKTNSEINNIVPEKVSTQVVSTFNIVDDFRDKTLTQVTAIKKDTQNKIDQIKDKNKITVEVSNEKVSLPNATEKPIAYIKLFLFSLFVFILGTKIIFYGLSILIIFWIIRFIYRKIRNR